MTPKSMNLHGPQAPYPTGCAGAVWTTGEPSEDYCTKVYFALQFQQVHFIKNWHS